MREFRFLISSVAWAQRSLYAAQQGLIAIRLSKLTNQVQLYAVLGGGGDAVPTQAMQKAAE